MSPAEQLWEEAIRVVLKHEGGLADHPSDPGGVTKYGISFYFLKLVAKVDADADVNHDGRIGRDDILALTPDTAAGFYRRHWWDRYRYADLPPSIAVKIMDLAVNMGGMPAHRCLQRAARACGRPLADDGAIGPATRGALMDLLTEGRIEALAAALKSEAAGHYRALTVRNPALAAFEAGWMNRAYS